VAVETIGNWYWIVDEIEAAGMTAQLVHARKAKVMMGCINKTDRLDARGLNRLQRTGTLPTVWIPPGELRDYRDLTRTRMYLVSRRSSLKNRLHATLARYALTVSGVSDWFGKKGRQLLAKQLPQLPEQTRFATECQLAQLDELNREIAVLEERMKVVFTETATVRRLRSLPGVGFLLAVVIALEIGDIDRFATAEKLASYAGTTPRVHASGGRVRYGTLRSDVNHYLKWAFAEAGNSIALNHQLWPERHVSSLYRRLRSKKGHAKAIGAVARHLAEASYWILKKEEPYRDRGLESRFAHGSTSACLS
jgi:transposase